MIRTLTAAELDDNESPRLSPVLKGPYDCRLAAAELTPPRKTLPRSGTETVVPMLVLRTTGCWTLICAFTTDVDSRRVIAKATWRTERMFAKLSFNFTR